MFTHFSVKYNENNESNKKTMENLIRMIMKNPRNEFPKEDST